MTVVLIHPIRPVERAGERGGSFPGPHDVLGAPPSLIKYFAIRSVCNNTGMYKSAMRDATSMLQSSPLPCPLADER